MKTYNTYKASGIEWMEDIPAHWDVKPLKSTTDGSPSSFMDGDWIESPAITDDGIRYLTTGNVGVINYKEQGNGYISEQTFNDLKCSEVFPGDILISRLNIPLSRCCIVPELGKRIVTAVDNVIYRPNSKYHDKRYMVYLLNSARYAEYAGTLGRGTTMKRISRSILGTIKVCIPPLFEQQAIASYLDHKVGQIDASTFAINAQIDDLKAYRMSVISEAVTKGLNPDAPMKDSGVEWIGKIPEGWEILKMKNIFSIVAGATPDSNNTAFWDGDIAWVTPADFKSFDHYISSGKRFITREGYDSCSATLVPMGSIVFSKRAPIGSVVIAQNELCTNQGCLSCIQTSKVVTNFYYYALSVFTDALEMHGSGTTFKEISVFDFSNFRVPYPSLSEQQAIASYLDYKTSKIDAAIASLESQRDDLNALKQSVISEAVTGKIDVRGWKLNNEQ